MPNTLNVKIALRIACLLLLVLLCFLAQAIWLKNLANEEARDRQLANAREHYAVVLSDLDRRWGREALNLKTRIEAQNVIDASGKDNERLLSYLISQGSSIEFPSLRIEKANGEQIVSYDYSRHLDPKLKPPQGKQNTWVVSQADGTLYLAIRQFIWLGKENGYLLLFKPMDHALLTQNAYPGTRLSLWWQGQARASSDGEEGLGMTAAKFPTPENGDETVVLSMTGPTSELTPKLLVEIRARTVIDAGEIARPVMLFFLVLLVGVVIAVSTLWPDVSRQLDAVLQANKRFAALGAIDEDVIRELHIAQAGPSVNFGQIAEALEKYMRETSGDTDQDSVQKDP